MSNRFRQIQNTKPQKPPYEIVGTMDGSPMKLFFVGFDPANNPLFAVADMPEKVNPDIGARLGQILAFNPEGWILSDSIPEERNATTL